MTGSPEVFKCERCGESYDTDPALPKSFASVRFGGCLLYACNVCHRTWWHAQDDQPNAPTEPQQGGMP